MENMHVSDQSQPYSFTASQALLDRARATTPGGVHSNVRLSARPQPLIFERGEGIRLWDIDGNMYLDFLLGQGPMLLGHANPTVVKAVEQALGVGQLFAGQHRNEIELTELLCETIPCAEQLRLCSSGSEAVQAALRAARAATGRYRVIKFEGHYHGWFDNIYASVTPSTLGPAGMTEPVTETAGQVVPTAAEVTVLPWNDVGALERELAAGGVAAVIMEPVAANHSVIPPQPGYLEAVRRLCSERQAVLIFDEIITGFRFGLGGAQGRFGVTPDLAVFGKAMASGFPIACLAGKRGLFEGIASGRVAHAGTFNANVSAVAAALATVRTLHSDSSIYEAVDAAGSALMDGIRKLGGSEMLVQGFPELFWVGFGTGTVTNARDLSRFDQARTVELSGELVRRGVYVAARGTWYLSAYHRQEDVAVALDAFEAALSALPSAID